MTLVDTNLLIYATFVDTPEHERAHAWLVSRLAEGDGTTLSSRRAARNAGRSHAAIAAELTETSGLRSDDVPDVEIAALAIEHGLVLASHDHGFRRFSGLSVLDPPTPDADIG